jgi:hypothetical protein
MNKIIPVEIVNHIISYVNFVHPLAELIKEHYSVFDFTFVKNVELDEIYLPDHIKWNMNENMDIIGFYSTDGSDIRTRTGKNLEEMIDVMRDYNKYRFYD